MKSKASIVLIALILSLYLPSAFAQQQEASPFDKIKWQEGPCSGMLGKMANVGVPGGYVFADSTDTKQLMEIMHNPTSGKELGFLAKADSDWFIVFEFDDSGYVKDDEKNSLDASAMLESIKKGNAAANEERKKRGWAPLNVIGWYQPPRYNTQTHNLEWAIKGESEGHPLINWNTRLLGRNGVMRVTLVADPAELNTTMPHFRELITGFSYSSGHRYAEFRQGDKMAKYGLSALVVGGATALAAKTGILKYLWKALIVAGIAALAFLKKLFGRSSN